MNYERGIKIENPRGSSLKQGTKKKYAFWGAIQKGHFQQKIHSAAKIARSLLLGSFEHVTCAQWC